MATSAPITASSAAMPASVFHQSTVELSIRLFQDGVTVGNALKSGHGLVPYPSTYGTLLYETSKAEPPDWARFLESSASGISKELSGQHSSAVLLVEAGPTKGKRLFAICFGQGHHAVDTERMERQFGLRVVLNSVARNKLRSLDSASLDTTVIQRRTHASRESDLVDFGLDTNRELLRLASGNPDDASLAKAMSGKDVLQVRRKMAISDLPMFCGRLLTLYNDTAYQTDYKFIDQVQLVYKGTVFDALEAQLFAELGSFVAGNASDLHLVVPDVLGPEQALELCYYGPNLPHKKERFEELAIEDYVAELKKGKYSNIKSIADIRAHEVLAMGTDPKKPFGSMKVYDCFVYETVYNGITYVLFDGQWYCISDDYYKVVEQSYLDVLKPAFLLSSSAKNEQVLIAELCGPTHGDLLCMDQTKVSPTGAKGANMEPCDFFSQKKQLIHLKASASSAPLSHLWNQGLVSAQSFRLDKKYRKDARKEATARETKHARTGFVDLLPKVASINPSDYTVVYGILKKKHAHTKKLGIPFFSKVALRGIVEQLTMMGYNTELHLIEKL